MEHQERTGCHDVSPSFLDKTVQEAEDEKREERVRVPWTMKAALFFAAVADILFKREWKDGVNGGGWICTRRYRF